MREPRMADNQAVVRAKLNRIDEFHRPRKGRIAVLVVDMQHGFLDEGASLAVPKGREVLPNVVRLVETARGKNVPVVFTEFVYATNIPCLRGDPFGPEHLPPKLGAPTGFGHPSGNCLIGPGASEGPESALTVEALQPRGNELVIRAHTYDKFYGTPLDLALRTHGINHILVTGVTTDVCVNSTILSAANRNYKVTAVTDGMATIHDHIHDVCLAIWQNKFARLSTTEELIAEITAL